MPSSGALIPYHDESFSLGGTALNLIDDAGSFSFTLEEIKAADEILISVSSNPMSYRYTDQAPTASESYSVATGESITFKGKPIIARLQIVALSPSSDLFITLFTYGVPPA